MHIIADSVCVFPELTRCLQFPPTFWITLLVMARDGTLESSISNWISLINISITIPIKFTTFLYHFRSQRISVDRSPIRLFSQN